MLEFWNIESGNIWVWEYWNLTVLRMFEFAYIESLNLRVLWIFGSDHLEIWECWNV